MASLFKQGKYYYLQFYDKHRSPNRKRIPLRVKRKREALRKQFRLEDAYAEDEWDPWRDGRKHEVFGWEAPQETEDDLSTLGDAKEAYLASCTHLRASTQRTYRNILDPFTRHLGAEFRIARLRPKHVTEWLDTTDAGLVTRHKYVNHLGYLFRFLVRKGWMDEDLSKKVPLEKLPKTAPKAMSEAQLDTFVEAVRDHMEKHAANWRVPDYSWLIDIARANVHLGLRRGELIHLRWKHVDLGRASLRIANTDEFTTKSGEERTIPLSDVVAEILTKRRKQSSDDYAFTSHRAGKIRPDYLSRTFMKFRRRAGLPEHFSLHSTRHTFGTWLAERGTPVTVIQSLMGHSTVTTTEKYMHARPDVARRFVEDAFG